MSGTRRVDLEGAADLSLRLDLSQEFTLAYGLGFRHDFQYGVLYLQSRGLDPAPVYMPYAETAIVNGRAIGLYQGTALINDIAYLLDYRDVLTSGMDAEQHYDQFGWREGRGTGSIFDTAFYLAHNPDVAAAGVNPVQHYLAFGAREGRDPAALFDTNFYLETNADVAASGMNPLEHYLRYGRYEARDPNSMFDAEFYLRFNDAARVLAGDALASYIENPGEDATSARFIASVYLDQNPDVAASGMNPLAHYILYGRAEGRAIGSGTPGTISGPDTGTVREDGPSAVSGRLIVSDVDPGEAGFTADANRTNKTIYGDYGSLQIETDGRWTYRLNDAIEVQALRGGETVVESLTVRSIGYDEHTISITIQGTNDAALIRGGTEASLSEATGRFAYGQLTIFDQDRGEGSFPALPYQGTYGTLAVAENGAWTYEFMGNTSLGITPGTPHAALEEAVTIHSLDGTEAILRVHIAALTADAVF